MTLIPTNFDPTYDLLDRSNAHVASDWWHEEGSPDTARAVMENYFKHRLLSAYDADWRGALVELAEWLEREGDGRSAGVRERLVADGRRPKWFGNHQGDGYRWWLPLSPERDQADYITLPEHSAITCDGGANYYSGASAWFDTSRGKTQADALWSAVLALAAAWVQVQGEVAA